MNGVGNFNPANNSRPIGAEFEARQIGPSSAGSANPNMGDAGAEIVHGRIATAITLSQAFNALGLSYPAR